MAVDFQVPLPPLPDGMPETVPEQSAKATDLRASTAALPAAAPDTAAAPAAAATAPAWGLARRVGFRFAFCYLVLYNFPFPLYYLPIPGFDTLLGRYLEVADTVVLWTGAHVLHLSHPIEVLRGKTGSGDTTYDWVQILCHGALAAAAALAWSFLARRARDHRHLDEGLRIYVRYSLGSILLGYGIAKVIKTQFPFPSQDRLLEPIGQASPMGLLWTFMGVSTPYTVFAGAMEVLGGVLLFFRRTTVLGALVTVAVMTNVFLLNMCYDVPVKQFSAHLLLMAGFLLLPDLRRLANVLVLNRPAAPGNLASPWSARWARIAALALCLLYLGYLLYTNAQGALETQRQMAPAAAARPAVYGTFEVEEFFRNGQVRPPLLTDTGRWRRLSATYPQMIAVRWMDDSLHRYWTRYVPAQRSIVFSRFEDKNHPLGSLGYERPDPDHLVLQGSLDGEVLRIRLRRLDPSRFKLVSRGFHWISEYPYNQ